MYQPKDPVAAGAQLGPLSSQAQVDRVRDYIQKGIDEGAKLVIGGPEAPEGVDENGYFVKPTVFSEVSNDMTIAQEEIFGPVLSILPYDDVDEAVAIAKRVRALRRIDRPGSAVSSGSELSVLRSRS